MDKSSNPVSSTKLSYRPELDGIRALAIICVIMFHYDFHDWWGGFTGVDIFFVLSGFLICGQTYVSLENNSYSVLDFFARRIRRLSTAYFVCFLTIGVVAYWLYLPNELFRIFNNLFSSTIFVNNYTLLFTQGYFNLDAEENPFLHTWSLSIEEQFYIFLPILILLTRRNVTAYVRTLVTVFIISLALMLFSKELIYNNEQRFFSSIFRVWELALGALVFLFLHKRGRLFQIPFLPVIGLIIALVPTFILDKNTLYPSLITLMPTLGAAILIASCSRETSYVGKFLASKVMSYIGRISYGTYLWHWPFIAYYRYAGFELSDKMKVLLILASFACGAASHHFIESPMRRISIQNGRSKLFKIFAAQSFILVTFAAFIFYQANLPAKHSTQTLNKIIDELEVYHENWNDCWWQKTEETFCKLGENRKISPDFIVWGDSMANSALWAFDDFAKSQNKFGYLATGPSCAPIVGVARDFSGAEECLAMNESVRAYLKASEPIDIYLFARWSYYSEGYDSHKSNTPNQVKFLDVNLETINEENIVVFEKAFSQILEELSQKHRVIVINQVPVFPFSVPKKMLNNLRFGVELSEKKPDEFVRRSGRTIELINKIAQSLNIEIIEPQKTFCSEALCYHEIDGRPVLSDHTHLSITGNKMLYELLQR
jgi:peptidoglycan/LPS O-acetylase OafA/YrhL